MSAENFSWTYWTDNNSEYDLIYVLVSKTYFKSVFVAEKRRFFLLDL